MITGCYDLTVHVQLTGIPLQRDRNMRPFIARQWRLCQETLISHAAMQRELKNARMLGWCQKHMPGKSVPHVQHSCHGAPPFQYTQAAKVKSSVSATRFGSSI